MARGRMINREICLDKKINALSDDTSRLAFTWLISFADKEGRVHGDPAIVRSMLFPRRDDVSIHQVEAYIKEWAEQGLIIWYEAKDDLWIYFPAFEKNQVGLRKDREPESFFPAYTDECRVVSGNLPDNFRQASGLREGKGREGNTPSDDADGKLQPGDNGRPLREIDVKRGEVEQYFSEITGISMPPRGTDKQNRAASVRWWLPIREILKLVNDDTDRAKQLIGEVYHQMRDGPKKLTVSSPQSILQNAISTQAEWDRNGDGQRVVVDV